MAPVDDDKPGGPFQGLPRPAAVRRRAEAADLPPPTRGRDAPREEMWDDDEEAAPRWEPAMRRDPRREADGRRLSPVPTGPDASLVAGPAPAPAPTRPPGGASKPGTNPGPAPRDGLLSPAQRYAGRAATGLGYEGLAAALGLNPKNGQRAVRRWEQENPEPDPDDRAPPRYVELLTKHAASVPEVAAYLREQQGRGRASDHPPRPIELLLLLAAEVPEVAAYLREQGRGAPDAYFRNRRER